LHNDESSIPRRARLSAARFRRRRLGFGLAVAAVAVPLGVGLAVAAPSLEQRLDSASSEADQLSGTIEAKAAEIADLEQRAREAGAREMELNAEIERTASRSRELAAQLETAEAKLERVRARYKRAVAVLSERLVDIYKGADPDYASVLLESNGYDDLQSRAIYLDALHDADRRIADQVAELNEQVSGEVDRIGGIKAEIDTESQRLEDAQAEFADTRGEAQQRMAEVSEARAGARSRLAEVEGAIEELEQQQLEASSTPAYEGGPYAIPTYIVMCESGGNYRAYNPSSGAGGAYQIIPSTWRAYGGEGLAHQAPKAEQDRIAAMIWRDSGPSAWSCA
jgi:septal ring factor EnvC (AmiA/AmiB activator)